MSTNNRPSFPRAKSQDAPIVGRSNLETVQRSLIESAQNPVAMHVRPTESGSPMKILSPRLSSIRADTRSPPRFAERQQSPSLNTPPQNILRLGSHRRVFSDDASSLVKSFDNTRRASLGETLMGVGAIPQTMPAIRRSSLNDSLLRRQYSNRPDLPPSARPPTTPDSYSRRYFSPTDPSKVAPIKGQPQPNETRRDYQVRVVKGPHSHSPIRSRERHESETESYAQRSVSPDETKRSSRVVVSIPETLIAKIQQALKEAGEEGLSCAQLMNTPSCKRLRFPCTLQGATPGSILRELPCVRHDSKRYYYVEPPTHEFAHRRISSRTESVGEVPADGPMLRYSAADLLEARHIQREETEFDILLKERLSLLGLLPSGEDDEEIGHVRRPSAPVSDLTPVLPHATIHARRESSLGAEPLQSPPLTSTASHVSPPPELQTDASVEVQEFTRMLQHYKTYNFCIDNATRVNESASALLTLLSKCNDIPQALYGPGVFPLVRRIYEKTKETPFWSECRASVHQVITTALQLPQNSSSQQSWLMRFLLGCEASTEERASNQSSSSEWGPLSQEILGEIALLHPGESLRIRQQGAIERMGVLSKTIKLGLQVFGPVAFGLASILSDVHLQTVGGPKTDAVKSLLALLQESPQYRNVQMIRPGMIQCFDVESALTVTVCCHSRQEYKVASEMTALVLAYRSLDARFELLFQIVSKWAQLWNLIDEVEGLSLWGWILLVVHYMQSMPTRILPVLDCFVPSTPSSLKARRDSSPSIATSSILALAAQTPNSEAASNNSWTSTNTDCIGELLVGFFKHYGSEFNPETQCVSVRMGTFLDAADYRATLRALDPSFAPTPHPYISVASPAHVALAYSMQPEVVKPFKSNQDDKASSPVFSPTSSEDDSVNGVCKSMNADLKSTEVLEEPEVEELKLALTPDSKMEVPARTSTPPPRSPTPPPRSSTPPPTSISEVSIKPVDVGHGTHRKTPSLTTISEVAKPSALTPSSATRLLTRPKNCEHALCVEDPFRPTENVAMNTSRAALRRIQEALEIARANLTNRSLLRQIFVVPETEVPGRPLTEMA